MDCGVLPKNISVIGLGKLGTPMLAVLASKDWKVIGVDLNDSVVKKINNGVSPWNEPKVDNLLRSCRSNYHATSSIEEAVQKTDVTFVIVPTPSKLDGYFDNSFLISALQQVGKAIAKKQTRHIIVVTSTVMPGSMDGELKLAIEKSSGKVMGEDFGFCYNPEFIALGSVVSDMLQPDLVLIGESDKESGAWLQNFYASIVENQPAYKRMRFAEAEVTKLAINTYVTTKISYANMVSELCEKLPRSNSDVVLDAVGCDSRIGRKYLQGGTAYGGPCFPRDNRAFTALGESLDSCTALAAATDYTNAYQTERLAQLLQKIASPFEDAIGIMGLSYKPGTPVIDDSQGIKLAKKLSDCGFRVNLHDELAVYDPADDGLIGTERISCLKSFFDKSDILIMMVSSKIYLQELQNQSNNFRGKTLIDPWRKIASSSIILFDDYLPLGVCQDKYTESRVAVE